jgi:ferredoxin
MLHSRPVFSTPILTDTEHAVGHSGIAFVCTYRFAATGQDGRDPSRDTPGYTVNWLAPEPAAIDMHVEFDRDTCIGMFNCVHEWGPFEENDADGKADLAGAEEREDGVFVLAVPDGEEFDAKLAARVCPVDAITVYDEDGEQLVP